MLTLNNQAIADLNGLNAALNGQNIFAGPNPLGLNNFDQTNQPNGIELDQAIANCTFALYDYIDTNEVLNNVNPVLNGLIGPPPGYTLCFSTGAQAYVNPGGLALDNEVLTRLVDAANNFGNARHQTANARNIPTGANSYVHCSNDRLFAFRDDAPGGARPIPRVTVLGQGSVSDGVHSF